MEKLYMIKCENGLMRSGRNSTIGVYDNLTVAKRLATSVNGEIVIINSYRPLTSKVKVGEIVGLNDGGYGGIISDKGTICDIKPYDSCLIYTIMVETIYGKDTLNYTSDEIYKLEDGED